MRLIAMNMQVPTIAETAMLVLLLLMLLLMLMIIMTMMMIRSIGLFTM